MFEFCSLYSGSTGNSLFVQSANAKILIDAGESAKKICNALSLCDVDASTLDAIIVTHEHSDHIKSLGTLSKKYNIPVYANKETWKAMPEQQLKISEDCQKIYNPYEFFEVKDLKINPFKIPHDAANPCGFNIYNKESKISIATDLGHVTDEIFHYLENSSFALLESNYDSNILKYSSYPYLLKQRISGPYGHLSNTDAGLLISKLIRSGLESVLLGHLSKENNFPELAYKTVMEELINNKVDESVLSLGVARRDTPSKMIKIV